MMLLMANSAHLKLGTNVTQLSSQLYLSSRLKPSENKSGMKHLAYYLAHFLDISVAL